MAGTPTREWTDWAFYNDGTESGSTIIGAENTNPTLELDTVYFFRVGIEETADNRWSNPNLRVEQNVNSGGWETTGTGKEITAGSSANVANGDDTTQRITVGQFTWDTNNNNAVSEPPVEVAHSLSLDPQTTGTEILFVFTIDSTYASGGDSIELRLWDIDNADTLDVVNQTNPTITIAVDNITEIPTAGSLTLTGIAPLTSITGHVRESVPNGSITLTGIAPQESITGDVIEQPPSGSLTLTGFDPIATTPGPTESIPSGSLILTGIAPLTSITGHVRESIPSATLILTGFTPTDYQTGHVRESIPNSGLVLTGFAPLAAILTDNITESPLSGNLTLTGFAPTVTTGNIVEPVPSSTLILTGIAPDYHVGEFRNLYGSKFVRASDQRLAMTDANFGAYDRTLFGGSFKFKRSSIGTLQSLMQQWDTVVADRAFILDITATDNIRLVTYDSAQRLATATTTITDTTSWHTLTWWVDTGGVGLSNQVSIILDGLPLTFTGTVATSAVQNSVADINYAGNDYSAQGADIELDEMSFFSGTKPVDANIWNGCGKIQNIIGETGLWSWFRAENDYTDEILTDWTPVNSPTFVDIPRKHCPSSTTLTLTGIAPLATIGPDTLEQIPNGALTLTSFAPQVSTGDAIVPVPNGVLTLTGFTPTTRQDGITVVEQIPNGQIQITGFAPDTNIIGDITEQIPLGTLRLASNTPTIRNTGAVVEIERPTGGISKRVKARKQRQIMIDGRRYSIDSPEQEYFLLQRYLDKVQNQLELDLQKKKTPIVKRKIKLKKAMVVRTANRIDKVSEEIKWREKLRQDDEEILALLAA